MELRPKRLDIRDGKLVIEWNDGQKREIAFGALREVCPCATCREKRAKPPAPSGGLNVLSMAEARPLAVLAMRPVGNYAYSIAFSDGHDTGIFTLELLRSMGTELPK
jgi:DUF971 family protein